jgi:hypothetical protein
MKRLCYYAAVVAGFATIIAAMRCTNMTASNTSEVGNPKLYGHLVDGRIGSAAQGAMVRIYPVYLNKMAQTLGKTASGVPAIDSTLTDHNGYYSFDSLKKNVYSIQGEYIEGSDTLYMRHPSVMFIESQDLGYDTLRLPGWIKGKVVVPGDETPKNITCYIPGTSYMAITNDTGGFRITGIPAGTYSLSITSARFRDTTLYGFKVTPNHETNAGDIVIGLDRSKNEHDVWGVFDSTYDCKAIDSIEAVVSGDSIPANTPRIYRLDWRPSLSGYSGFIYVPDNGFFWKVDIWVFDTLGRRIGAYRLPTINRATGDVEVPSFNPFNSIPVISLHDTTVSINDSIRLHAAISTLADDSIVGMEWKIGNAGTFTNTKNGDTAIIAPKNSGSIPCIFRVTDKFGNIATDTAFTTVITDPPVITIKVNPGIDSVAGKAITVPVDTTMSFDVAIQQRFGSVAMITWIYQGTPEWTDSGEQLTTKSITFGHSGKQLLICKVRDDDGNVTADTVAVAVVTPLSGVLTVSTVLTMENSPYLVRNDLFVPNKMVLTISPGTEIRIGPGKTIFVYGTLHAEGTDSRKIQMFTEDTTVYWGLNLHATCIMRFCEVSRAHAHMGITTSDTVFIDSCIFNNTDVHGNQLSCGLIRGSNFLQSNGQTSVDCAGDDWRISGNTFVIIPDFTTGYGPVSISVHGSNAVISANSISGGGISVEGANPTISANHVSGRSISIGGGEGGIIEGNIIENGFEQGITVNSHSVSIYNNRINNNTGSGIFISGNLKGGVVRHNEIKGNRCAAAVTYPSDPCAGIVCVSGSIPDSTWLIDSNVISNNSVGVMCDGSSVVNYNNIFNNTEFDFRAIGNIYSYVDISVNWWGTTDTASIQRKIYDRKDDPGVLNANIFPIQQSPVSGAGPK